MGRTYHTAAVVSITIIVAIPFDPSPGWTERRRTTHTQVGTGVERSYRYRTTPRARKQGTTQLSRNLSHSYSHSAFFTHTSATPVAWFLPLRSPGARYDTGATQASNPSSTAYLPAGERRRWKPRADGERHRLACTQMVWRQPRAPFVRRDHRSHHALAPLVALSSHIFPAHLVAQAAFCSLHADQVS